KERISDKKEILLELSKLSGVYVPCFYEVNYNDRGEIISISPNRPGVKTTIKRQIVADLDNSFYPVNFIVPNRDIVHDRAVVEIARGCTRGCRFCAAGISYRPVRERSREKIIELADKILAATGYEELSLSSLSTVDHSQISELVPELARRYADKNINIALPSLRVDRFSVELAKEVQLVRKSGLTFAPEAGTQRLRNVINKGVNERDLYEAVRGAFEEGWSTIKLYFMLGLPTETFEDLAGIERLVKKVLKIGRKIRKESSKKMRGIKIHVSVSTFVPKPFTPFQWVGMDNREEIEEKQQFLMDRIRGRGLNLNWNEPDLSLLEGVFSRGDRRLAAVLETAWKKGCRFEGWNDTFSPELWQQAFAENNIEMEEYLFPRTLDQILPWDHINMGISKEFLEREYRRAMEEKVTEDCRRQGCSGCNICDELGVKQVLTGGDVNDNQG
ncbi:MAG: TIGR03960 family B12-binding radical SAM protein, partial [Halanaerobiales bacterium]